MPGDFVRFLSPVQQTVLRVVHLPVYLPTSLALWCNWLTRRPLKARKRHLAPFFSLYVLSFLSIGLVLSGVNFDAFLPKCYTV